METRYFGNTLCKQKVKAFFLSTLIALNVKWVPHLMETRHFIKTFCKKKVQTFFLSTFIAFYRSFNALLRSSGYHVSIAHNSIWKNRN